MDAIVSAEGIYKFFESILVIEFFEGVNIELNEIEKLNEMIRQQYQSEWAIIFNNKHSYTYNLEKMRTLFCSISHLQSIACINHGCKIKEAINVQTMDELPKTLSIGQFNTLEESITWSTQNTIAL